MEFGLQPDFTVKVSRLVFDGGHTLSMEGEVSELTGLQYGQIRCYVTGSEKAEKVVSLLMEEDK